jgi:hypothetical protein
MRARTLVLALLLVTASGALLPAFAHQPSIGLYFDADGATCSTNASIGIPIDLYVNFRLGGPLEPGFVGAEFSITGIPADWWILAVTPNQAASVVLGNPFTGCNIVFQECQGPPGGLINLYVIRILPVSVHTDVRLEIHQHLSPSCPGFCCAHAWACDAPVYTQYCVGRGQAFINGPSCTVGVEPTTWGDLKRLYD